MTDPHTGRTLALALALALASATGATSPDDLLNTSIEDLMKLEVVSVGKREQPLFASPSAIYVLTHEDIRRSGATSIPEVLRLVPGVQVARIDANKWAVSARGFNNRYASKLLVLFDGRSLYSPSFAGVYWETQDTPLGTIARIEIIRGPGAAMWGANAVNGVINIITSSSAETVGGLVTVAAGVAERANLTTRVGAAIGDNASYRVYAKYNNRGDSVEENGEPAQDAWAVGHGGFRVDVATAPNAALLVEGDVYHGEAGETRVPNNGIGPPADPVFDQIRMSGGSLLARYRHGAPGRPGSALAVYFDRLSRRGWLRQDRDMLDLDFQRHEGTRHDHDLVWGLGYRVTTDGVDGEIRLDPIRATTHLASAFLQDEITLRPERLRLTLGARLERSSLSGVQFQPDVRLLFTPGPEQTWWTSLSRAVRTPDRVNHDAHADLATLPGQGAPPTVFRLTGNPEMKSESVIAWQAGHRLQHGSFVTDLTTFYNVYRDLQTLEPRTPFLEIEAGSPRVVQPLVYDNLASADTYGLEAAVRWQPDVVWQIDASYTWLRISLQHDPRSLDAAAEGEAGDAPEHQFNLRSHWRLPHQVELDASLFRVGAIHNTEGVPGYTRVDLRIGWHPVQRVELSLVGQNLFDAQHLEFDSAYEVVHATEVRRAIYLRASIRF